MMKAFQYRIYPNVAQQVQFKQFLGCAEVTREEKLRSFGES